MVASLQPESPAPSPHPLSTASAPGQAQAVYAVPALGKTGRTLSTAQVEAICKAMHVFLEDDLARGVEPQQRLYCDGCERARPAAGFIQYDRYGMCNACATEYEVAHARALVATPGQFIRDKRFGEAELYAL